MCGIWVYLLKDNDKIDNINDLYNKFYTITGRGPDNFIFKYIKDKMIIGFHRLKIMDLSEDGNQPFEFKLNNDRYYSVCNGEIYNAQELKENELKNYNFKSGSDCEVLIPLYLKYGLDMCNYLDGVFSFVLIKLTGENYEVVAARDRIGVRPSFIGYNNDNNSICISSEIKGLTGIFDNIDVFTPGKYLLFDNKKENKYVYKTYYDYKYLLVDNTEKEYMNNIRDLLIESVEKRLISDKPVCALLSGGLDSSLVCSIASRLLKEKGKKLYTFSIGMEGSPDVVFANKVARYIGSEHTVVRITNDEALNAIRDVVWATETFDITTIRASTGQYLISKYIANNTNFKVVLSGDGSDELTSGYLYNFNAPSLKALHNEAIRRIKEIHLYDGLRADRATSIHGLELRVPFLDYKFVDYYLSINPIYRELNKNRMEKYLLRKSFEGYLPDEVLWRQKEAFSDGISSSEDSWYTTIQKYANLVVKDLDNSKYRHCKPKTKEALYFRNIFNELFSDKYCNVIPEIWMPMWTDTDDPSARTIKNIYKNN